MGSVGTRAWIALLLGRDDDDPLFLQIKEAEASVLEPHLGPSRYANHGQRVVDGQRLMQAASDIFLGWFRDSGDARRGPAGLLRAPALGLEGLGRHRGPGRRARSTPRCAGGPWPARTPARATASPSPPTWAPATGSTALRFAEAYADQNERDHRALAEAVQAGRVAATTGL